MAAPIAIEVLGYDLEAMALVAEDVEQRLSKMPGLADVKSSVRPGHPEARVSFDREKTLEYGLDLSAVSTLVRDQVLGNVSTRFQEGDERIAVRVIGDEAGGHRMGGDLIALKMSEAIFAQAIRSFIESSDATHMDTFF